jgi:transposase
MNENMLTAVVVVAVLAAICVLLWITGRSQRRRQHFCPHCGHRLPDDKG